MSAPPGGQTGPPLAPTGSWPPVTWPQQPVTPPPPQPPYSYGPPPLWGYSPPPPYGYPPVAQRQSQTEGTAIAILVLSIASFVVVGVGVVMAIVALALCPSAKRKIQASNGALDGDGLLTAARIIAWVNIGLVGLMVVGFIALIAIFSNSNETDEYGALLALASGALP